ncbi:winged helix-turn-helix transcriptional regulator [archaeon]|jgi:Lrp/AsnC family transcriptional regulator, leucine-responsive regulatory protein|nr:winged helix-turn-helix transcriptional regulator [archaeon]MBT6698590.1 winged helix-turn-helix transcriptional regulator [archaeon]
MSKKLELGQGVKLDKLDLKILKILDWNARMPNSKVAKKVGSSKDVVAYRIKRLEETGIIKSYFPVLDMYKLGFHTSRIYFDLEELSFEKEKEFVSFLDKEIHAGVIFKMDHFYHYGIFVWTKSIYDIEEILNKIKSKLGKYLLRYDYTIISTLKQYPKDYLFGENMHQEFRTLEPRKAVKIDEKDFAILKMLAANAKSTTVDISKKLKIPQSTISSKIKLMQSKQIIQGYRAQINFSKLGYTNYFLEIYLNTNDNIKKIEAWTSTYPNVVWLQKIIGTCDIEIEVEVESREQLELLLKKLREKFPNIRKIIFWLQEYKKFTYLPYDS